MGRSPNKRLLGFQAGPEIWEGVYAWLERPENYGKTQSDFLLAASMEKLAMENIPVDRRAAMQDGRTRPYPAPGTKSYTLNDQSAAKVKAAADKATEDAKRARSAKRKG